MEDPEIVTQNGVSLNGVSLNGVSLNGVSLNGVSLNGVSLNGVSLNGVSLNGVSLNGVSLNGVSLNGVSLNGSGLGGTRNGVSVGTGALAGATLTGVLSDGRSLSMRVDRTRTEAGIWFYGVSFATDSGWQPVCGLDGGSPREAIALAGRWDARQGVPGGGSFINDPTRFTFACRGNTIAKCVELGYKPWASAGGVSLRDHHQACTRMIRGDYCGDGTPGTIDGWSINVYDNRGIQTDTQNGASWVFEAEWTPTGAACVDEYRVLEMMLRGEVPVCASARLTGNCGSNPAAILKNEYNSAGVVALVQAIVNANPGTPLADKVEDGLHSLENAFAALATSPPDRKTAIGHFEGASGDFEAAVKDRLLGAGYGNGLLNRVAGAARQQVQSALTANACKAKTPSKTVLAKQYLAQGDVHRAAGRYKDACERYKAAVGQAEDAMGNLCP